MTESAMIRDRFRSRPRRLVTPLVLAGVWVGSALAGVAPALSSPKPKGALDAATAIEVEAKRLPRFSRAGETQRFGRLAFRGGLVLTSRHPAFGGWSGLTIAPDGRRLVAVSDAGAWLTADLVTDAGRPTGLTRARIGPLRARNGKPLTSERERDAEAVTLLEGSLDKGVLLIAFEQLHRIGRFPIGPEGVAKPTGYLPLPPEVARLRRNKSLEALTLVQGGPNARALVAFAEQNRSDPARHLGWIWLGGKPRVFRLSNPGGFEVTDAASTGSGDLVVLERRFRWLEGVKMRLRFLPADRVRPGAEIEGEILLEADMSFEIDNMEGLAIHRDARGETVLTLISDDNFNSLLQRTLLLQFALSGVERAGAGRR